MGGGGHSPVKSHSSGVILTPFYGYLAPLHNTNLAWRGREISCTCNIVQKKGSEGWKWSIIRKLWHLALIRSLQNTTLTWMRVVSGVESQSLWRIGQNLLVFLAKHKRLVPFLQEVRNIELCIIRTMQLGGGGGGIYCYNQIAW